MTCHGVRSRGRRGSTLVEFALVVLLLVLVLLSTVEFERMLFVSTTLANAARAGLRYAASHGSLRGTGSGVNGSSGPGSTDAVVTVVQNFASAGILDVSKLNIQVSYANSPPTCSTSNGPGCQVTVQVTYPYDPFVGWLTQLKVNLGSTSSGVITY